MIGVCAHYFRGPRVTDHAPVHRHRHGHVILLADLHLDAARPAMLERFRSFSRRAAQRSDPVYLLGDVFEAWIGDDDDGPVARTVMSALAELTGAGTPVWFMPGNRDFLVGADFLARTGVTWLEDPTIIDLHGVRTLLCHGDTLCTGDIAYQRFRSQVRSAEWREAFLARPLSERRALAAGLRADSGEATGTKTSEAMDATSEAIAEAVRTHHAERIIHGHTHRPARHVHAIDGGEVERWVLADWYREPAVLVAGPGGLSFRAPEDL
jgi:UDP-2,3-diacylglucosamine hydrolase